jgi:hypothetical protein
LTLTDTMTDLDTLPNTGRPSAHRPPAISLPSDPAESAALVLRYVQHGTSEFERASAIEAANARLALLRDPDNGTDHALDELARHLPILDALFQRYAAESVAAKHPDHRAKFAKLALAFQASHARTVIAVEGLKAQRQGKARVLLASENGSDDL